MSWTIGISGEGCWRSRGLSSDDVRSSSMDEEADAQEGRYMHECIIDFSERSDGSKSS